MAADFWDSVAGDGNGGEPTATAPRVPYSAPSPSLAPVSPTAQVGGYTHDQLDSRSERNQINEHLRNSPQWRDAIKAFGLNPDGPLKLDKKQQQSLARQLGLPTSDFHIDGAGNINDFHGWKGLPVAAKVAIIAGAAAATAGAGGMFSGAPGAFGMGGGAAGGAAGGVPLASVAGSSAAPMSAMSTMATTAAAPALPGGFLGAFGAPTLASSVSPAAFGMAAAPSAIAPNIATQAASQGAGGGGFLHALGGLFKQPGMKSQVASGAFNLAQGAIAAQSAKRAAEIQAQYGNRALDFEQGRYDRSVANTQPYVDAGRNAYTSLSSVLQTPVNHAAELDRLARGGQ